jgi:MFS family permease
MSAAWLLSSVLLGKRIVRLGGKTVIFISLIIIAAGAALLTSLTVLTPVMLVILSVFVLGFGFGGAFTTLTIVIQTSVSYRKRGAAMAANTLLRTLGQTIGISVLGIIFNFAVGRYFQQIGIAGVNSGDLYTSAAAELGVTEQQTAASLSSAVGSVSLVFLALSVLCVILILLSRESRVLRRMTRKNRLQVRVISLAQPIRLIIS